MSRVFVDGREYRPIPPAPNIDQTFGAYLTTLRTAARLTQARAAQALGVPQSRVEALERDTSGEVPTQMLLALSCLYAVSLDILVPCYLAERPRLLRTPIDLMAPSDADELALEETEENDDDE